VPGVEIRNFVLILEEILVGVFVCQLLTAQKVFRKFVLAAAVVVDFAGVWVFPVAVGLTLQQAASSR
jgi:hypothetical protein